MRDARLGLSQGNALAAIAWVAGVLVIIWLLANNIAGGQTLELGLIGLGLVVATLGVRILANWRLGFYLFIVLLLFEDLSRKYLHNNSLVFFAKEVLVALVYVSFFTACLRHEMRVFRPPFSGSLALLLLWAVAQVFNPTSPHVFFGVLGLKVDFYYLPLMLVTYELIRTEHDLERFLVINCVLACLIGGLGIIQSIVGPDFLSPRNLAPELEVLGHMTRYSPITHLTVTRPTSVFVSDGRFAQYVLMSFIMAFGAGAYLLFRKTRSRLIVFGTIGLMCAAAAMSGSRGVVVYVGIAAVILSFGTYWGAPWRLADTTRLVRAVRRTLLLAALGLSIIAFVFPKSFSARLAFYSETLNPSSTAFEGKFRAWDYPWANFVLAFSDPDWVLGHGIGTGSLSAQYVAKTLHLPNPLTKFGVENGHGMLMLELGIAGLILWMAWSVSFTLSAGRTLMTLRQKATFPLALSVVFYCSLLLFPMTWGGLTAFQNYVTNGYFWMLAGLLFRLPGLEAEKAARLAETTPA
jgi:hypothetical protein